VNNTFSFSRLSSPTRIPLKGGYLFYWISASDFSGRWFVQCDKHKDFHAEIYTTLAQYEMWDELKDYAQKELNKCSFCYEEHVAMNSRWPEGAEL
jgi:hypothetical protein